MVSEHIKQMCEYVDVMRRKVKEAGSPGYLHYRVLCDYIRDAIADGIVQLNELGFSNQLQLYELELECINFAIASKHIIPTSVDFWFKHALEAKIAKLHGAALSHQEEDNVVELFPEVSSEPKAA